MPNRRKLAYAQNHFSAHRSARALRLRSAAPLSVSGQVPSGVTRYALIAEETIDPQARAALDKGLALRGLRAAGTLRADVVVGVELSDRPLASGTVAGTDVPVRRDDAAWNDRPQRSGRVFARAA